MSSHCATYGGCSGSEDSPGGAGAARIVLTKKQVCKHSSTQNIEDAFQCLVDPLAL